MSSTSIPINQIKYIIFAHIDPEGPWLGSPEVTDTTIASAMPFEWPLFISNKSKLFNTTIFTSAPISVLVDKERAKSIKTQQDLRHVSTYVRNLNYRNSLWYDEYSTPTSPLAGRGEARIVASLQNGTSIISTLAGATILSLFCSTPGIDGLLTDQIITNSLPPKLVYNDDLERKTITNYRILPLVVAARRGHPITSSLEDFMPSVHELPASLKSLGLSDGESMLYGVHRHLKIEGVGKVSDRTRSDYRSAIVQAPDWLIKAGVSDDPSNPNSGFSDGHSFGVVVSATCSITLRNKELSESTLSRIALSFVAKLRNTIYNTPVYGVSTEQSLSGSDFSPFYRADFNLFYTMTLKMDEVLESDTKITITDAAAMHRSRIIVSMVTSRWDRPGLRPLGQPIRFVEFVYVVKNAEQNPLLPVVTSNEKQEGRSETNFAVYEPSRIDHYHYNTLKKDFDRLYDTYSDPDPDEGAYRIVYTDGYSNSFYINYYRQSFRGNQLASPFRALVPSLDLWAYPTGAALPYSTMITRPLWTFVSTQPTRRQMYGSFIAVLYGKEIVDSWKRKSHIWSIISAVIEDTATEPLETLPTSIPATWKVDDKTGGAIYVQFIRGKIPQAQSDDFMWNPDLSSTRGQDFAFATWGNCKIDLNNPVKVNYDATTEQVDWAKDALESRTPYTLRLGFSGIIGAGRIYLTIKYFLYHRTPIMMNPTQISEEISPANLFDSMVKKLLPNTYSKNILPSAVSFKLDISKNPAVQLSEPDITNPVPVITLSDRFLPLKDTVSRLSDIIQLKYNYLRRNSSLYYSYINVPATLLFTRSHESVLSGTKGMVLSPALMYIHDIWAKEMPRGNEFTHQLVSVVMVLPAKNDDKMLLPIRYCVLMRQHTGKLWTYIDFYRKLTVRDVDAGRLLESTDPLPSKQPQNIPDPRMYGICWQYESIRYSGGTHVPTVRGLLPVISM